MTAGSSVLGLVVEVVELDDVDVEFVSEASSAGGSGGIGCTYCRLLRFVFGGAHVDEAMSLGSGCRKAVVVQTIDGRLMQKSGSTFETFLIRDAKNCS